MKRRMQERHDRGGSERGQYNKQGSMEEYHHQLYRRPQMTGQAREEEEVLHLRITATARRYRKLHTLMLKLTGSPKSYVNESNYRGYM